MSQPRRTVYRHGDLVAFAAALLEASGLAAERARVVAGHLVEADLMGHTTHGLQLAAPYLGAIADGSMAVGGEPAVIADRGAVVTWDGGRLPGVWLADRAVRLALERVRRHGTATVVIRRSHHIACLATYLPLATAAGCLLLLASSDPSEGSVAPYGGRQALFTPNPIAIGIPTEGDPILIDISASITTNGMTNRLRQAGQRFPGPWALDAAGRPSDDPAVVFADPPGSILPIGGLDHGHKGFGLALTIEALTQGLGGYGRADQATGWGASVFVQVLDPAAFGGLEAFTRQSSWLAEACRRNPPAPGVDAVRLPGERALARRRAALAEGLDLHPGILDSLQPWAERLGVPLPAALVRLG
jgi:LDH2 family malate/lactate/ureidoglycolate dehydrogenase